MLSLWGSSLYQNELEKAALPDSVWEKLYGKSFLITGATGMVCSFLVDLLMKRNGKLSDGKKMKLTLFVRDIKYAQTRFPYYESVDYFKFIELDVVHIGQYVLENLKFDYIIAGAGNADPKQFAEYPVETMESNLYGVSELLKIARGQNRVRVLYLSTGEVYGNAGEDVRSFSEGDSYYVDPTDVRACYPGSKRAAETFCAAYHKQYGVNVVVGRLCYIYGPTMKATDSRSVAQFFRKAINGENVLLKSRGEQVRSYCYILDAVSALLFLLVNGKCGEAYNISNSDSKCSIAEFAGFIAQIAGVECVHSEAAEHEKAGYSKVSRAVQSPEKINAIGWKAEVSLQDGIRRTVQILQDCR